MTRGSRFLTALIVLVLMAAFGAGVNRYLASRTSGATAPETTPTTEHPQFGLPGTVYFADKGGLFALQGTKPVQKLQPEGQGWTQPVLLPGGSGLLAVKVTANYYSDLYQLSLDGAVQKQLSHNAGKVNATNVGNDDWIYYPSLSSSNVLYFSYDYPKQGLRNPGNGYQVDYSIYSTKLGSTDINRANIEAAVNGRQNGITQESWANYYTGGDVQPVALNGGGVIFTDYEYPASGQASGPAIPNLAPDTEISQIRMDPKPVYGSSSSDGTALTQPGDDCAEPALNPAQTEIAMVCTPIVNGAPDSSRSDLVVATFDAATASIGPLQRLVTGTMAASPTWSPNGTDLIYLAPEAGDGYYQIWYVKNAAGGAAATPRQVTTHLDLDATSAPAWSA